MGRKVHPKSFRLAVTKKWTSVWFSKKDFSKLLQKDVRIRNYINNELKDALLDSVEIERSRQKLNINIHSAKPGIIIGRAGAGIIELNDKIKDKFFRGEKIDLNINVKEVKIPSLSARVVARQVVIDIEKRMPFRRVMKQAVERVIKANAEGVKVTIGGRLNGAEIARSETIAQGKIPLHNLRADIDYSSLMARTIYGAIGIKVWINRGEIFSEK